MRAKFLSEFLGTALLLAVVVGSGIMGERLAGGNDAIALLANSFATGLGLAVLILIFGPISGAQFNPAVSLVLVVAKKLPKKELFAHIVAQAAGALFGVVIAHLMFNQSNLLSVSPKIRSGFPQMFSEFVATAGLILTIRAVGKTKPDTMPFAVGAYIAAAYWFTASTSFANPAVTLARAFTPTFAGISPDNVLGFIIFQILGALAGEGVFRLLGTRR